MFTSTPTPARRPFAEISARAPEDRYRFTERGGNGRDALGHEIGMLVARFADVGMVSRGSGLAPLRVARDRIVRHLCGCVVLVSAYQDPRATVL